VVAESVPEAKVIAAFFGKSHFSDGHDGIPEHLHHNEGCEQMISGKSQIRCRIPHSKGLWCVGPFIALVLLFTAIVPVNEVGEGLNLKRLV
jgi:hypothetical protein